VVEDLTNHTYWLIKPDGAFAEVTEKDVAHCGYERLAYPNGFSFFKGGMYLALDEAELSDPTTWEKYLHVGTYSAVIWLIHEGFHETQGAWAETDLKNRDREDHLDDMPARVQRALLQKQLFHAVSRPGDTQAILAALATYEDWKTRFPLDFEDSVNADRYEGTAYYFEFVASLLAAYPDQVTNLQDVDEALALLATREDAYIGHGLVMEGYSVGGFAAFLLDRLEKDWKERLMADPAATPIEMLRQHFSDQKLPAPTLLSQTEIDAIAKDIIAARDKIASIGADGDNLGDTTENNTAVNQNTVTKVITYLYDRLYWWLPKK
jgi:pimeloyl-ACP methyl ester carboxylesterase